MGVCLPLAVLLGYVIAQPLESGTLAVIILIFSVLVTPLLMKWYHPVLILSWNACVTPFFLPGQFNLWVLVAIIALFFAMLNRSVNPEKKLIHVPEITMPLLFLTGVVLVTALLTGGIGIRSLGGERYGGSRYVYIFAAVAGYFALTSRRVSPARATRYVAIFFLPGLTALISNLAYALGPSFYFLYYMFPATNATEQAVADYSIEPTLWRMGGLMSATMAIYGYMLARYGLRAQLSPSKPFRLLLFIATAVACVATGYRAALITFVLIIGVLFYLEGMHRTRWLAVFIGTFVAGALIVLPFAYKLPLSAQRTLSFLPANIDSLAKDSANASTQWRLEMWREVLPEIPKYLLKGRGYLINPDDLDASFGNSLDPLSIFKASGDYHNGPLSVLIPLGIFGMIAFIWFLGASIKVLVRYRRLGDPQLHAINTFLLTLFIVKTAMFFLVFGGFYGELFEFTGIIGLAVCLNGAPDRNSSTTEAVRQTRLIPEAYQSRERERR